MKLARMGGISLSLGLPVLGLLMVFQNCAKIQTVDMATEDYFYKKSLPVPQYMSATIGQDAQFPALKMVFVADNSYSMVANNVTMANSFQNMFNSQLSTSLDPFETSIFITSTAQNTVAPGGNRFNLLPKLDVTSFAGRSGSAPDPTISGDVIGYRLAYTSNSDGTYNADYTIAPVVGFSAQGVASDRILKPVGGSVADLSAEFQKRLKVLDGSLVPDAFNGIDPLDNESGMCGLARMLKSPDKFFKTGDQVAFIIASDERDNSEDGSKCIENISKSLDASTEAFTGTCDSPITTINLKKIKTRVNTTQQAGYVTKLGVTKVTPPTNDSCNYSYSTGISVVLSDSVTTTTNESCTYSYVSGIKYQTNKKTYSTKIDYTSTHATSVVKDNLTVWKSGSVSKTVSGKVSNCLATIQSLDPYVDATVTPVCTQSSVDNYVTSTLGADKLTALPAKGSNCSAASDFTAAVNPASFDSCTIVDYVTSSTQTITYASADASQASANARCQADAEAAATGAVKNKFNVQISATLPVSTTKLVDRSAKSYSLTGLSSLPSSSTCSNEVKALVAGEPAYAACRVSVNSPTTRSEGLTQQYGSSLASECTTRAQKICSDSVATSTPLMGCSGVGVAGLQAATSHPETAFAGNYNCSTPASAVGSSFAGTLGQYVESGANVTPGSCVKSTSSGQGSPTTKDTDYDGTFTCDSMCTDSGGLCSTASGAATLSVKDFLAKSNTTCNSAGPTPDAAISATTVVVSGSLSLADATTNYSNSTTKVISVLPGTKSVPVGPIQVTKKDTACTPYPGSTLTMNPKTSIAPGGVVTKFVVGNKDATTPAMSLSQYIYSRSQELFGSNSPLASAFVITSKDVPGPSQSLGANYSALAGLFGGSTESINAPDYSPALVNLSGLIKSRLSHSVLVTGMQAGNQVRQVWLKRVGDTDFGSALDTSLYSTAGNTVIFGQSTELHLGDQVKVEYW